jgi:uncharacterized membrane protein
MRSRSGHTQKNPAILPITSCNREHTMRTIILALAALSFSAHSFAQTASANHGHHGGGNHGAMGAAAGASAGGSSGAGQSGMGGSYWAPNPNASVVDAYQPWPQSEMRQFQKP